MAGVLVKRERDLETQRDTQVRKVGGHVTTEAEWSVTVTIQGRPRMTGNQQKLEEARKDSSRNLQGEQALLTLRLGLSASRTVRGYIFVVLSQPVCYGSPRKVFHITQQH